MSLISVIIPNLNGLKHLPTCFEALRKQTYPQVEIILVDNASSDESVSVTQRDYPEIKILQLNRNFGFAGAVNRGIVASQGEIVALLNNDTEADPFWLEALANAFTVYSQAGCVASKILLFNQRTILHSAGDGFGQDGRPLNRGVWQTDEGQFDQDTFIFGGCGGAVAYRKAMLNDIGLFDEDFFMYCEDVDLNWRAQIAGYACIFAPQAIVYHHLSATGGGAIVSYYTGRNTIFVLTKSVPSNILKTYFFKIIHSQFAVTYDALCAWRGEAARARLKGQLAGLVGLPRWLGKRRTVQQTKKVSDEYIESLLA